MSWKDQSKAAQRKVIEATATKSLIPQSYGSSYGYNHGYRSASPFMRYLLSSASYGELAPNPRSVLDLYELMAWAIPELAAVIDLHVRVIGFPEIETKDAVFQKDWDDFVKEFLWKCELDHPFNTTKGLASYIYTLSRETLSTGQGFTTLLDSQGNPIQRASQSIDKVRLHESRRFDFVQWNIDQLRLTYEHGGTIEMDVKESPAFASIQFQRVPKWAWGMPVLYGTERAATAALLAQEAHKANNQRITDPSEITIFSFEPTAQLATDALEQYENVRSEWKAKTDATRDAYKAQIQNSNANGRSFQALEVVSGGKLEVKNHLFGAGIQPAKTYAEDVSAILASAIIGAYASPDLFGISTTSGGGLGTDQHTKMAERMESFGIGCRPILEQHIGWLTANVFLRKQKRIPDFKFKWVGFDLSNGKGKAEIQASIAGSAKLNAETAELIANGAGLVAVNSFLEAQNSVYRYPKINPQPL